MKNGETAPASARATNARGSGTSPTNAVSAKAAAVITPAAATRAPGRRALSRATPASGAAMMLGPSETATRAPPMPMSSSSCTARIGRATAEPARAILGGIDAAR